MATRDEGTVPPPCQACGHHVSMHAYHPTADGLGGPPQECRVPGCGCTTYEDPRQPTRKES